MLNSMKIEIRWVPTTTTNLKITLELSPVVASTKDTTLIGRISDVRPERELYNTVTLKIDGNK